MGNRWRSQHVRLKYTFIKAHRQEFETAVMCRLLGVSRSGSYAWLHKPREIATAEIYEYIELFYNCTRRHSHLSGVSPETFEGISNRA